MEPVISKRGKLIFEDDFSGKELEWAFGANTGEWKIVKKTLTTKSVTKNNRISIRRTFPPLKDVIFELRMLVSSQTVGVFVECYGKGQQGIIPTARFDSSAGGAALRNVSLSTLDGHSWTPLAMKPFPYRKARWVSMVFEIIGSQYALTVDGRTVTYEQPLPKERVIDHIRIGISQSAANPFAIDDVKVYEALPKDGDEKGKKKKKRKKR